jgi:hypothetical protein
MTIQANSGGAVKFMWRVCGNGAVRCQQYR